ncbi:membrane associated with over 9 transmembrane domains [Cryptosporidium sp. chipmunk genotype I]|uniref:membrane associated with over 9 transmembrane domains n=1 Tax=Cryptosporidium sp. chipmunk genotype I TaxID=1280935 RepID=UPI00351A3A4B|nr:membrane associated with over 9 transmembrane domains [Cryptosporidium sp. chipmunk genotype I]
MRTPDSVILWKLYLLAVIFLVFGVSVSDAVNLQLQSERIKSISDLTKMDIISLLIVGCFASIAVSAGGGGGIISMPIFLSLMRVPFSQAVTFSSAIILGGVICALITNLLQYKRAVPEYNDAASFLKLAVTENQIHEYSFSLIPIEKAPLIDIQIVLFIAPLLTLGSLCGIFIGRYVSNLISIFALNTLLLYVLKVSISKFNKIRKSEKKMTKVQNSESELFSPTISETKQLINTEKVKENLKVILYLYTLSIIRIEKTVMNNINEQNSIIQTSLPVHQNKWVKFRNYKLWISFVTLCFFSVWISILDSGILFSKGSRIHLLLWLSSVIILLVFPNIALPKRSLNLITSIINSQERLAKFTKTLYSNISIQDYETIDIVSYIQSKCCNNFLNYVLASLEILLVGLIGGVTGASGGILISTIFYFSQVDPSSIAANNSTCLIISTLTCFFTYLFERRVHFDLAILLIAISVICTLIGKNIIDFYVRKHKLSSIIVGILIILISASLIYMNLKLFALLINY